jgi:hypothetical protein
MLFGSWQTGAVERDEAQKLMVLLDFLHFASKHLASQPSSFIASQPYSLPASSLPSRPGVY